MSPTGMDIISLMHRHRLRIFTTADFRTLTHLSATAATQTLRRLAARQLVLRIKRGVWVNGLAGVHAFEAVPFLTAPWPAYVSLHSALSHAGIVAEIPHVIYGVTSGPPAKYHTAIGDYSLHHLPAHLLWGFTTRQEGAAIYLIAEPEKAFLDLVYLALMPRSPLQMPHKRSRRWNLDAATLKQYAARFQFPALEQKVKSI